LIEDIDYKTKRPYGLIPNGDVLQIFYAHLRSKGTSSVSFSKVKGHATPEDVVEGRSTSLNRAGNDMSDKYATKGIQAHNPSAIHYSTRCAGREEIRINLQHDLNLFLLDMLEANRQVVAKESRISKIVGGTSIEVVLNADGPTRQEIRVPTELQYFSTDGLSTSIVAKPHISMLGSFKRPLIHIVTFSQLLEFKPVAHDAQGISWLELSIIFELWGGIAADTRPLNRKSVRGQKIPESRVSEL